MKFEDIYQFFEDPPPVYLNKELAVCYVLSVLTRHDSYGTELIHAIEQHYPSYRLSDTVLYSALKFLEHQAAIMGYWKKVEGRGRPRRMYRLRPDWQMKARELADLWQRYMVGQQQSPPKTPQQAMASQPSPVTAEIKYASS
jgi:DNA-binding PadR family transcriptional regulator